MAVEFSKMSGVAVGVVSFAALDHEVSGSKAKLQIPISASNRAPQPAPNPSDSEAAATGISEAAACAQLTQGQADDFWRFPGRHKIAPIGPQPYRDYPNADCYDLDSPQPGQPAGWHDIGAGPVQNTTFETCWALCEEDAVCFSVVWGPSHDWLGQPIDPAGVGAGHCYLKRQGCRLRQSASSHYGMHVREKRVVALPSSGVAAVPDFSDTAVAATPQLWQFVQDELAVKSVSRFPLKTNKSAEERINHLAMLVSLLPSAVKTEELKLTGWDLFLTLVDFRSADRHVQRANLVRSRVTFDEFRTSFNRSSFRELGAEEAWFLADLFTAGKNDSGVDNPTLSVSSFLPQDSSHGDRELTARAEKLRRAAESLITQQETPTNLVATCSRATSQTTKQPESGTKKPGKIRKPEVPRVQSETLADTKSSSTAKTEESAADGVSFGWVVWLLSGLGGVVLLGGTAFGAMRFCKRGRESRAGSRKQRGVMRANNHRSPGRGNRRHDDLVGAVVLSSSGRSRHGSRQGNRRSPQPRIIVLSDSSEGDEERRADEERRGVNMDSASFLDISSM